MLIHSLATYGYFLDVLQWGSMGNNCALNLQNISKDFGKVSALSEISLSADVGQILCLVGRSGCGKSTLLRVIGGVDRPNRGAIFVNGEQIVGENVFVEPDKRQIGFVFQDYALFPHLTVEQNIAFGIKHRSQHDIMRRVGEMLDLVGLHSLAKRYVHTLSGGEQQRIALARALAPNPKLVLLDEPFSNLDLGLKRRLRAETIDLLRQVNATAILVTHDPQEALSIGDKVVLLDEGKIVQWGTGDDLYHRPVNAYAARFFSEFNILEGKIKDGAVICELGRFPNLKGLQEGTRCKVYIRPSNINFVADVSSEVGVPVTLVQRVFMGELEELSFLLDNSKTVIKMTRFSGIDPVPSRAFISASTNSSLIFE